jgi:cyclopropane fatty-acyl-phospholipid synthase-like methyltransferase
MTKPSLEVVRAYYDEHVSGKIRDFTHFNPRIEAAIAAIAEWAPAEPRNILEIGCGIGATAWRMARAWPQARVIGADVSPASIRVAKTCFRRPNLEYHEGLVTERTFEEKFDLVVLMDTYEHIALEDRAALHRTLKGVLADEARVFLSVPTPAILNACRVRYPSELQPVDEDVALPEIMRLATDTATHVLYYREIGVWRYGDYAHTVVGRFENLAEVAVRRHRPKGVARVKAALRHKLRGTRVPDTGRSNYLGSDVLRPGPRDVRKRFRVSAGERARLVSAWSDASSTGAR